MALQAFFYDQQIRRYIIQFIRMLSNFQVEFGKDRNQVTAYQRVPVIYGDSSRQAQSIIKQGSENYLNSVPVMAVYISGLDYDRLRLQNPTYVGKMNLRERYFDPNTGEYSTTQGDVLTVERLMPVPYKLTLKVDIWTSNTEQKLQLIEQLAILFNPALEIQSTDNYVDWTSLTYVLLTNTNYSSRSIPIGTENPIDVATLTFELPIFISAPALVKKLGVIQKIIASIYDANGDIDNAIYNDANILSRQYITPLDYGVVLFGNELRLVRYNNPVIPAFGEQIIKQIASNVSANTTITVDNTTDIEPGMIVSGLTIRGPGTITTNTNTNVVEGTDTHFLTSITPGQIIYSYDENTPIGTVATVEDDGLLLLTTTAQGNLVADGWEQYKTVNSANCAVINVNGQVVTTSNLVTANVGDRIVFTGTTDQVGSYEPWRNFINIYGNLVNGTSQVRLELADGNEIVGTVSYNPIDDTTLLYSPDPDTLPTNTVLPVNAIIDPQSSRPSKDLQNLAVGTRYLLVNDYVTQPGAVPTYNWQGIDNTPLVAYANDIIQYNGSHWIVAFDSRNETSINYVTNMTTNTQYRWNGVEWAKSYEGYYENGKWQLVI
jgi:hypothetical protein